ncbi:MAG: potassium-transporting ATPase subunit KdpC [Acidobacteriota bacterium]
MRSAILISIRLLTMLTVITGIAYPLLMTGFAWIAFPERSQGGLVWKDGAPVGAVLIGQQFTSSKYFHSRRSAGGYDPMSSGATNFGATSRALHDTTEALRARFAAENSLPSTALVPPDMLSASGSGLDPEISPEAALLQVGRVARVRHFSPDQEAALAGLVQQYTRAPELGVLGRPRVNVLLLNLALDTMSQQ